MESRKYFVEQVATTILENHAKTDDSFIFGISGKWGEGKTFFLGDLEKQIKEKDLSFEIVWINPWKFASDKISFLRAFLAKLPTPLREWYQKVPSLLRDPAQDRDLYFDVSKEVIDWRMVLLFGLYLCWGLIIYFYGSQMLWLGDFYNSVSPQVKVFFKIIGVSILIPGGLAIFKSLSTYQQGSKTISTIDKFDELLRNRLAENVGKKFLVYIDDLDRVTPTVARDVLDNLRTFFDKPNLSFVVAGDHTVLERYIGKELMSDGDPAAQLEEGRRYLKKIFNVYWRLPPPIATELAKFIQNDLFATKETELKNIFKDTSAGQGKLASFLASYFDGNFRQISRFFDMVLFTFQIIEKKRKAVPKAEKRYFNELIENPLLVVRILMIQENCTPLFEMILKDQEILLKLEDAVETKNAAIVQEIINEAKLSDNQKVFINKFIFEEPRFFKDSSLVVSDLRPFLVFAADSSFGDGRGPSSQKFIEILTTGNPEALKNSILSSGEPKLKEAANSFVRQYNSEGVTPQQSTILMTLLSALKEVPSSHNSHGIFAQKLKDLNYQVAATLPVETRHSLYQLFWSWLDMLGDEGLSLNFADKFKANDINDFIQLKPNAGSGSFATTQIIGWFKEFYPNDRMQVLNKLIDIQSLLDKKAATTELNSLAPALIEDVVHNNQGVRNQAFQIVTYAGKSSSFKAKAVERMRDLDQDLWDWIKAKVTDAEIKWDAGSFQEAVISKLDDFVNDYGGVTSILNFASNNKFPQITLLWEKVIKTNIDLFFRELSNFAQNPLPNIAPDKSPANTLFQVLFDKMAAQDPSTQASLLRWLKKDVWFWQKLDKIPNQKAIETLAKNKKDPNLAQAAKEVLDSWKSPE